MTKGSWTDQFSDLRLVTMTGPKPRSVVRVSGVEIGGTEFVVMAGPCAVESEEQVMQTAESVAASGARFLRGGAFKPRSSPYSFQGLGLKGLKILRKASEATGLRIVTEVMDEEDVAIVAEYADMLQIGARNMANLALLEAAARSRCPILLKRGITARIRELLEAAECILAEGNPNVVLCERGIRTFETVTRNTFDIGAVPVLKAITHLPVIVDPSHAAGINSLVPIYSRAAVAIGADGLLVEVHPAPECAMSDGEQSLTFDQFRAMMRDLQPYLAIGRALSGDRKRATGNREHYPDDIYPGHEASQMSGQQAGILQSHK